jgi:hypothetical protein
MSLQIYDNEADVPADLKPHYRKREADNKFVPDIEGWIPKERLEEVRTKSQATLDNWKTAKPVIDRLKELGLSIEDIADLHSRSEDLKAEKLFKKGDIDKLISDRTEQMRGAHKTKLDTVEAEKQSLADQLARIMIEDAAVAEAMKYGLLDTAVEDIKNRARNKFKWIDGKARALKPDGQIDTDADGNDLSIIAWIKQTANNSKHLFRGSTGGGGGDQHRGNAGAFDEQNNPWMPHPKWDLTKQGKIMREDPQRAERLAAAAGHQIGTVRFRKAASVAITRR